MNTFDNLYGRDTLKNQLNKIIEKKRINNALIFEGPKDSGKKLIATAFSNLLMCENPLGINVCNACNGCKGFRETYITEREKSISVEDVRQMIADVQLIPLHQNKKIYLIFDAEKMTEQAQNAFLKTLEQPPEYAYFLLTVQNAEQLTDTIRSRSTTIYTGVNTKKEVVSFLQSKYEDFDLNEIENAASYSNGAIGKGEKLLFDQGFKGSRQALVEHIKKGEKKALYKEIKEGGDFYLEILQSFLRDAIIYKKSNKKGNLINRDISDIIVRMAEKNTMDKLLKMFSQVSQTALYIKDNVPSNIAIGTMEIKLSEELNI